MTYKNLSFIIAPLTALDDRARFVATLRSATSVALTSRAPLAAHSLLWSEISGFTISVRIHSLIKGQRMNTFKDNK